MQLSILFSSLKMSLATLCSRILGLVREQVLAAVFGASGVTDAFLVAYRIPNMLRDLLAEGAFSAAFVPLFTEINQQDPHRARRLVWTLFFYLFLLTGILSLGMIIFAPELVSLFAPKFTQDTEKFQLTVSHVRLMAPYLIFVSLAALFMGVLNTLKLFFTPALAPAFFNLMMIGSMLFLPPLLVERGIHASLSLALGVVGGGILQMAIQFPFLVSKGYGPARILTDAGKTVRKIGSKMGAGFLGFAATQINLIVTTIIATGTVVGAVSWLGYAFRLFQFPIGVLGVSIANSNLVHFSDAWKKGDKKTACDLLHSSYHFCLFLIFPVMALLMASSDSLIHLVFERGAFDSEDASMTTQAFRFYLFGLPFYGVYKLLLPVFYVLDRPRIPVIASVISIAFNIVFCLLLTPRYGFFILAAGTGLAMLINSTIQMAVLMRYLKLGISFFFDLRLFKFAASSIVCYLLANYLVTHYFQLHDALLKKITVFLGIWGAGAVLYGILLTILGERKILNSIAKKLKKR